ncbi:hypothetical protein [Paraherbaspirillum soli]|uniref:Uncharacterized protein n=1 Tax=Paraherbaspirillum soli TaxID=631222 RepID=A0ABW0MAM2_9BURK
MSSAILLGAVLYVSIYFAVSQSNAFLYAKRKIQDSKSIEVMVGKISTVSLAPFGLFEYGFVDSEALAKMQINVVGSKGKFELYVSMKEENDVWRIESVTAQHGADVVRVFPSEFNNAFRVSGN